MVGWNSAAYRAGSLTYKSNLMTLQDEMVHRLVKVNAQIVLPAGDRVFIALEQRADGRKALGVFGGIHPIGHTAAGCNIGDVSQSAIIFSLGSTSTSWKFPTAILAAPTWQSRAGCRIPALEFSINTLILVIAFMSGSPMASEKVCNGRMTRFYQWSGCCGSADTGRTGLPRCTGADSRRQIYRNP